MKRITKVSKSLLTAAIALTIGASVQAQVSPTPTVYASGLLGPRGLKFGPDGMLYVAEAGIGGTTQTGAECTQVPGPVGPYTGGPTGLIAKVDSNGNVTTVASGFPSANTSPQTANTMGVADLAFLDGTLYAVLAGGGCSHGNPSQPNGIVRVDTAASTWTYIADLSYFLKTHPAAYPNPGDFEPDGVFYSMIAKDGKLYTVEPNHGQVFSVSPLGVTEEVTDVSFSQGHIVPTSIVTVADNLYIGNLGQFPILTQLERVMKLSSVGVPDAVPGLSIYPNYSDPLQTTTSHAGFTTIVGLTVGPDGLLYVLEFSPAAGFPTPGIGDVVRLDPNGTIETVVTGLSLPTAMTFGPDSALYVSNFGALQGSAGQILRINVPLYQSSH